MTLVTNVVCVCVAAKTSPSIQCHDPTLTAFLHSDCSASAASKTRPIVQNCRDTIESLTRAPSEHWALPRTTSHRTASQIPATLNRLVSFPNSTRGNKDESNTLNLTSLAELLAGPPLCRPPIRAPRSVLVKFNRDALNGNTSHTSRLGSTLIEISHPYSRA